jgi:hypothetical protein
MPAKVPVANALLAPYTSFDAAAVAVAAAAEQYD